MGKHRHPFATNPLRGAAHKRTNRQYLPRVVAVDPAQLYRPQGVEAYGVPGGSFEQAASHLEKQPPVHARPVHILKPGVITGELQLYQLPYAARVGSQSPDLFKLRVVAVGSEVR